MIVTAQHLTPLCELAQKYGTDKLGFYTPVYDLLFSGRRDRIFKVLEVGIGTPEAMKHMPGYRAGASLRMWSEYFPNAYIYGLDMNMNACIAAEDPDKRIFCFCGSSMEQEVIPHLSNGGRFDIIIDDGDHTTKSQIETFHNLSPLLTTGGLYIIEDADTCICACLPEHTEIGHVTKDGTGEAIIIRQEALCPSNP